MLGFFFRHYDPWVDRYLIYDDGSAAGSLVDVLDRHPKVEVRRFERTDPDSFVRSQQMLQNAVWKASRKKAKWVVITALDEHLHVKTGPMDA